MKKAVATAEVNLPRRDAFDWCVPGTTRGAGPGLAAIPFARRLRGLPLCPSKPIIGARS